MTIKNRLINVALALGGCLIVVTIPAIGNANGVGWAHGPCSFSGNGTDISTYKKSQAKAYALVANKEGYHWGGGCWNNNNSDNQAGDPVRTESTHGEGGDCSGFTFKTWALENSYGKNGKRSWNQLRYIHGDYTAASFKNPPGSPIYSIAKSDAYTMEAFASDSHVGMIYTPKTTQGTDSIIEAKSEDSGTLIELRTYRGDSAYKAAHRTGWTPECYPQCISP
jgi:hypothetical protein